MRAAFGRFSLPPSRWNIVRVPEVDQRLLPFQPVFGSSMRPSTFLGKNPLGYGMRKVMSLPSTRAKMESLRLPIAMGTLRPRPNVRKLKECPALGTVLAGCSWSVEDLALAPVETSEMSA